MTSNNVALVTYAALPDLALDEQALAHSLATMGIVARPVVWDDPAIDWRSFRLCVIRSTWDYHHRRDEFVAWAERISNVTQLWNPAEVVNWNTHKTYLRDLAERGVPVVPTLWLERGTSANLKEIMGERGWESVVAKPSVSASAYATLLVRPDSVEEGQAHLEASLAERDMMVQPFIPSVETYGERSLMFIEGEYTHSVRRVPAVGEDREGGGEFKQAEAIPGEIAFAQKAFEAARYPTLYARVDIVKDSEGLLRLMELELVEPSLFLQQAPEALDRLARAIAARVLPRSQNRR